MGMERSLSCWASLRVTESAQNPTERCPKNSTTGVTPRADTVIPTGIRDSRSQHVPRHCDPGMRQEGLESLQGTGLLASSWATQVKVVAPGTSQLQVWGSLRTGQPRGRRR